MCLAFSLLLRAGLDPSASPNEITFSKEMSWQELGTLNNEAVIFADIYNMGPMDIDEHGWFLLHKAVLRSQHARGMADVVRGLLPAMSVEAVNALTISGRPAGFSALSLCCNGRDPYGERIEICELLVQKRADLELRNASGATPLITACAVGFVGREGPPGRGRRPLRHQHAWQERLRQLCSHGGGLAGILRAKKESHRCEVGCCNVLGVHDLMTQSYCCTILSWVLHC